MTLSYRLDMFGRADPELVRAAPRPYEALDISALRSRFPFVQDRARRDAPFRQQQHAWYEAQLAARDVRNRALLRPWPAVVNVFQIA